MSQAQVVGRITGKTVVVTGGSRGIGLGLVKRFLERGNRVVATTRNPADATQLHSLLKELGPAPSPPLHISQLDTADGASIREWAAGLREQHQLQHVDVLVNNAGVYGRRLPLLELEAEDFMLNFTTNALGPFFVTQQLLKQGLLGGAQRSLLVNMSSVMASHGDPVVSSVTGGGYAYRASKAALNIMNKAFALDLEKEGVSSVLMHPGYVATDMNAFNGWITAEESSQGILAVLESGKQLNNKFYAFDGSEVPW